MKYTIRDNKLFRDESIKLSMARVAEHISKKIADFGLVNALEKLTIGSYDMDAKHEILSIYSDSKKMAVELDISDISILYKKQERELIPVKRDGQYLFMEKSPTLPFKLVIKDVYVNPEEECFTIQGNESVDTQNTKFGTLYMFCPSSYPEYELNYMKYHNMTVQDVIQKNKDKGSFAVCLYDKEDGEILQLWSSSQGYLY